MYQANEKLVNTISMMWKDLNREHVLQRKNKCDRNGENGLKSKVKKKKKDNKWSESWK